MVLVVDDRAQLAARSFFESVDHAVASSSHVSVALDCEGVNLCRIGTVELVSPGFDSSIESEGAQVFLVDLGENSDSVLRSRRIGALKILFEDESVVKVIHDCRMDCDALYPHFDIDVQNVHDTSCFHGVITGNESKGLNDVLSYNGIEENSARDKSVYKRNPRF